MFLYYNMELETVCMSVNDLRTSSGVVYHYFEQR